MHLIAIASLLFAIHAFGLGQTMVALFPLALAAAAMGETQSARQVQPIYVRDEINWKKIPEQGKRA